jgi:chromosome partitioning protein
MSGLGWPTMVHVSRETSAAVVAEPDPRRASGAPPVPVSRDISAALQVPRETNDVPPVPSLDTRVDPCTPAGSAPGSVADHGVPGAVGQGAATPPVIRTTTDLADAPTAEDDDPPTARTVEHPLPVREKPRTADALPRPPRTRVMVVANQKGGVGKTTSTVNLGAALAQGGLRVLVVDLDPQGNASTALAIDHHRGIRSVYDAMVEGAPLADIVRPSPQIDGLFVVPATIDLAGAEIELVSLVAREGRLRKAIHAHPQVFGADQDRFDYVLIDCPPSLGLLTLNALVAGDEMLIPIQAEYYALEGLGQLLETVEMVKAHLNPDLVVSTIMLTMYDARTRLSAGVADEVRSHFAGQVLRTAIPRSVRISEAPSYGQTVMTYDPGSPGALSYLEAAREMALAAVPTESGVESGVESSVSEGAGA